MRAWEKIGLGLRSEIEKKGTSDVIAHGSRKERVPGALQQGHHDIMISAMQENKEKALLTKRITSTTMTCIPLRYLCGDFFRNLFSHGSRATSAAATSLQSSEDERRVVHHKESTSGEETTTSSSPHLSLQCRYNFGARQHDDHYQNRCTSRDDIGENEDILATCLHLYDIDIKAGTCYMLNLPQPRLPTPTVFDCTTTTFPEWACELRAYLNINQFEYINLLDFVYDAEDPLTTEQRSWLYKQQ